MNAPVLKTGSGESRSWVRIPPHPFLGQPWKTWSSGHEGLLPSGQEDFRRRRDDGRSTVAFRHRASTATPASVGPSLSTAEHGADCFPWPLHDCLPPSPSPTLSPGPGFLSWTPFVGQSGERGHGGFLRATEHHSHACLAPCRTRCPEAGGHAGRFGGPLRYVPADLLRSIRRCMAARRP